MADEKLLRKILAERYGIRTDQELLEAIENMEKIDIGWAISRSSPGQPRKSRKPRESA